MKVLVNKMNFLGDAVVFLPTLNAIAEMLPDADIFLATTSVGKEIFGGRVPVSEYFVCDYHAIKKPHKHPLQFHNFLRALRRHSFDFSVFSFDEPSSIYLASYLAHVPKRIGFASKIARFNSLLTDKLTLDMSKNVTAINFELARFLSNDPSITPRRVEVYYDEGSVTRVERLLKSLGIGTRGPFVVVHPFAKYEYRQWGINNYLHVSDLIERVLNIPVVFLLEREAPEVSKRARVASGLPLKDAACLLQRACLFLGNNSGPMHLAAAMGTPTVTIHGPSSPQWEVYWRDRRHLKIVAQHLSCVPCESVAHVPTVCLNGNYHNGCMKEILVEAVFSAIKEALAKDSTF